MRLVVGVDLSGTAERVVSEAAALSRATGAPLVLVHVARSEPALTTGGASPPGGHREPPEDLARRRVEMDAIAAPLRQDGLGVLAEIAIADDGDLAGALLRECDRHAATHLVVGTRGRARAIELLLGSVAQGVIRGARVPVIVVPPDARP